jgi:dTMP kinase
MARRQNSLAVLLRITAFRRMWLALSVSSLGDWLGLLATTALAAYLTQASSNLVQGAAVSGVLLTRLLPDLILGPIAGALVDRFDRRKVAIVGDTVAGLLYLSIVVTGNLYWLLAAQFLVEAVGLFSNPAKQALWVNIVPRERLAVANQLNYVSVYGMVPVAAVVFALLATTAQFFGAPPVPDAGATGALISGTSAVAIYIALVLDAATYFLAATVLFLTRRLIPAFLGERPPAKSVFSLIREGVGFVKNSRVMRAIYVGILGAFGAGGLVAGVAQAYVATMGAGNAGYGILFGAVFSGLALGMLIGPKVLPAVPRRMVFILGIGVAGCALLVMSLLQDFVGAAVTSVVMGLFAGIAWITGFTMIGHEVSDRLRGRVFAFVMSSVRLTLLGTIAVGPILANSIGFHLVQVGAFRMVLSGPAIVLAVSGLLTVAVAIFAARQVGGLRGAMVRRVLRRMIGGRRRELLDADVSLPGALISVVGVDEQETERFGRALVAHLDSLGWDVRYELAGPVVVPSGAVPSAAPSVPGQSMLAPAVRVLGEVSGGPAPLIEDTPATALRAMADLAELVGQRLRPALEAGAVVVCRDYVDAAVVRFGAQAGLAEERIIRLAQWATGGLRPDLTLLVDPVGDAVVTRASGPAARAADAGGPDADGDDADGDDAGGTDPDPAAGAIDDELVDPRRVYQDLAASAPDRYLSVPPLTADESVPEIVTERIAGLLNQRSPARSARSAVVSAGPAGGAGRAATEGSGPDESSEPAEGPGPGEGAGTGEGSGSGEGPGSGEGGETVSRDGQPGSDDGAGEPGRPLADRPA